MRIHGNHLFFALVTFSFAGAACDSSLEDSTGAITLVVQRSDYSRSDTISASLQNASRSTYRSASCALELERDIGNDNWAPAQGGLLESCAGVDSLILAPEEAWSINEPVRDWMVAGRYRFHWFVGSPSDPASLVSLPFTIEGT